MTVDLFEDVHARHVLCKFGQAYGKIPEDLDETSDQSKSFIESVVAGIIQDGKVVTVRLALFAEMVKDKAWVPETLQAVGGTEGVGVNFLEETFSSRSANLFEWVDDWYAKGMDRVACGGSWDGDAASCRTAHSNLTTPTIRSANLGFRLALSSSGIPKSPEADK